MLATALQLCTGAAPVRRRGRSLRSAVLVGIVMAVGCGLFQQKAWADEQASFELAQARFAAGRYEEAVAFFRGLLAEDAPPCVGMASADRLCRLTEPRLIEQARALCAAGLVALGREVEADERISELLRQNPSFEPDSTVLPQVVVDRFLAVRGRLREELVSLARQRAEQERDAKLRSAAERERLTTRVAELEKLASVEHVVRKNSRWLAMIPFGVGQFQNGDRAWGWTWASTQVLTGGASIALALTVNHLANTDITEVDKAEGRPVDVPELGRRTRQLVGWNRGTFFAWVGLATLGIVHAQATFIPERGHSRPRPLPPPVEIAAGPGDAGLALRVLF